MATIIDGNGDVIYTDNESIAKECGIPVKKNMEHHYANKRRSEAKTLADIRAGIKEVDRDLDKALKQKRSQSWKEKLKGLLGGKR